MTHNEFKTTIRSRINDEQFINAFIQYYFKFYQNINIDDFDIDDCIECIETFFDAL